MASRCPKRPRGKSGSESGFFAGGEDSSPARVAGKRLRPREGGREGSYLEPAQPPAARGEAAVQAALSMVPPAELACLPRPPGSRSPPPSSSARCGDEVGPVKAEPGRRRGSCRWARPASARLPVTDRLFPAPERNSAAPPLHKLLGQAGRQAGKGGSLVPAKRGPRRPASLRPPGDQLGKSGQEAPQAPRALLPFGSRKEAGRSESCPAKRVAPQKQAPSRPWNYSAAREAPGGRVKGAASLVVREKAMAGRPILSAAGLQLPPAPFGGYRLSRLKGRKPTGERPEGPPRLTPQVSPPFPSTFLWLPTFQSPWWSLPIRRRACWSFASLCLGQSREWAPRLAPPATLH